MALHRGNLRTRERHCQQALSYARLAADPIGEVSALACLGYTYHRVRDLARAAQTYEGALAHEQSTPLQRSRLNAELAVVYAEMQREQAALQALDQAEELYPEHPEQDPSGLYAALPVSPILERGLTYVCLVEQSHGHKYEHAAWATFEQIERPSLSSPVPERVRFEIVNHQARTAVLMNDLDAFEVYLNRGLDGAARLKSHPRYHEARAVWRRARGVCPDEPRVKMIEDRMRSPVGS